MFLLEFGFEFMFGVGGGGLVGEGGFEGAEEVDEVVGGEVVLEGAGGGELGLGALRGVVETDFVSLDGLGLGLGFEAGDDFGLAFGSGLDCVVGGGGGGGGEIEDAGFAFDEGAVDFLAAALFVEPVLGLVHGVEPAEG